MEERRLKTIATVCILVFAVVLGIVTAAPSDRETASPKAGEQSSNQVSKSTGAAVGDSTSSNDDKITSSDTVEDYSGSPYVLVNNNEPYFTSEEITSDSFEDYSKFDSLGRVGTAFACLGKETMPSAGEKRGSISSVYPTGWKQNKYDFISGKYLYNRCHLIGWQLSAENANERNLMTGTRDFNVYGMLVWEEIVAEYIKQTGNHVMYRVTPEFRGDNLLANGVYIEALSVEDDGEGIKFNVYCYNVQDGVSINYADGTNYAGDSN